MQLTRLRLAGFKSFVDPVDLLIEEGLTGVVGPNGCGKSNLVEALRWVMGESSYKNLRGSGMDDVIFSGSGNRPARNIAEVVLHVDNSDRSAPPAFNGFDALEISRKIEREAGSTYRTNGKEVRARDVQLLFADAATGARSSALVRQGQIGELISAKPQARRRVIEDAAGIAGLHGRRHEAELRLKASEANLERIGDVVAQIAAQLDGLKRQARQATRFREISSRIREKEAISYHLRWTEATVAVEADRREVDHLARLVAELTAALAAANKDNAIAAAALPDLRQKEAKAAARLMAMVNARDALDADERRIRARHDELERLLEQITSDLEREKSLDAEVAPILSGLENEENELRSNEAGADKALETARAEKAGAEACLTGAESALADALERAAALRAAKQQAERRVAEETTRFDRLSAQLQQAKLERDALPDDGTERTGAALAAEAKALSNLERAEAELARLQSTHSATETSHGLAREAYEVSRRDLTGLTAEARALETVSKPVGGRDFPPVLDQFRVSTGLEKALGAAFAGDLDHSSDKNAAIHWAGADATGDPALPDGCTPLADGVTAPDVLNRRLMQIGLVEAVPTAAMIDGLCPGQVLVNRDGASWRWDGLRADADAPTPAAQRLAQRNRLETLKARIAKAQTENEPLARAVDEATAELDACRQAAAEGRSAVATARKHLDAARDVARKTERAAAEARSRKEAAGETLVQLENAFAESRDALATARELTGDAPALAEHDGAVAAARDAVTDARAALSAILSTVDSLDRETRHRRQRLAAIDKERGAWQRRIASAGEQAARLADREKSARGEMANLANQPEEITRKRRGLSQEIETAEATRTVAADALAEAENQQRELDRAEREAQAKLAETREKKASVEAKLEATTARRDDLARQIDDALETPPHAILAVAGLASSVDLPPLEKVDAELERLRRDRERLGSVNLRAEDEVVEVETRHDALLAESADLETAIRKLRGAIGNLNREGRERLLAAFDTVNNHFRTLFTLLFGGGTAELQLIESDDPLEAGLEIIARPPGKKPQTLTLLSGGEQALTAIALIFAVFLTNPSPICVLDEVDAPLDDANVERYCDLLDRMASQTTTRFMVITHNPITMARMNRLFGVTMAERGVSQLVSVDLETAESYREAV